MNLKGQPKSDNFEDRTGWTPRQRKLHTILTILDPTLAAANAYDWMQAQGLAPIRPGVDLRRRDSKD